MHMSYWFGTKLENFLFQGYNIITTWSLVTTCLVLTALAILYEAMKLLQVKLQEISKDNTRAINPPQNTDSSSLLSRASRRSAEENNSSNCSKYSKWFLEVFHWSIHVTLGYLLMLAVMTFNGYMSIALVIGSGIGYYIFGPILIELNLKKLQKRKRLMIQCNPECSDAIRITERRESATSIVSDHLEPEVNIEVDIDVHT